MHPKLYPYHTKCSLKTVKRNVILSYKWGEEISIYIGVNKYTCMCDRVRVYSDWTLPTRMGSVCRKRRYPLCTTHTVWRLVPFAGCCYIQRGHWLHTHTHTHTHTSMHSCRFSIHLLKQPRKYLHCSLQLQEVNKIPNRSEGGKYLLHWKWKKKKGKKKGENYLPQKLK